MRTLLFALLAGLLLIGAGRSDEKAKDKAAKKPVGTWTREFSGHTITFAIGDDDLKITLTNTEGDSLDADAAFGVKGDLLFGSMTKVAKKGFEGAETDKGDLFSFTFSANDKEMTLSDLKGTRTSDEARKLIEGVYKKK